MAKFIVTADERPAKNHLGEVIGTTPKIAVFYSKSVGKHRCYRREYQNPGKGFELFIFDNEKEAQDLADVTNEAYGNVFKVEEI